MAWLGALRASIGIGLSLLLGGCTPEMLAGFLAFTRGGGGGGGPSSLTPDGLWAGSTSQGLPVVFLIADRRIQVLGYHDYFGCRGGSVDRKGFTRSPMVPGPDYSVAGGAFKVPLANGEISGTLAGNVEASGQGRDKDSSSTGDSPCSGQTIEFT